jgi:hypothetical protein
MNRLILSEVNAPNRIGTIRHQISGCYRQATKPPSALASRNRQTGQLPKAVHPFVIDNPAFLAQLPMRQAVATAPFLQGYLLEPLHQSIVVIAFGAGAVARHRPAKSHQAARRPLGQSPGFCKDNEAFLLGSGYQFFESPSAARARLPRGWQWAGDRCRA